MKLLLGLSDTQFDAGAALLDQNGRVLFAANEERYTRRKSEGGYPKLALQALLEARRLEGGEVSAICVAGLVNPPLVARLFPALQRWGHGALRQPADSPARRAIDFLVHRTPLVSASPRSALGRATRPLLAGALRRSLPARLRAAPIRFVDHHRAHAAGAWHASGFPEALAMTCDGIGDGVSLAVHRCGPRGIERRWASPPSASYGLFYEAVTEAMGFLPYRDEGKVMGLAAFGRAERVAAAFPFELREGRVVYRGPAGRGASDWVRAELLARHPREDVAAWLQDNLESQLPRLAETWLERERLSRLVLAGGVFANVKLNARLARLSAVEELFVCPNMGDGGLAHGAVCAAELPKPAGLPHAYLGDEFGDDEIEAALDAAGLARRRCVAVDHETASLLAAGKIVARFHGRMEWGPRALGHRSILAPARDPRVARRLNQALKRSDFMPFAPVVRAEDADLYFSGVSSSRRAAEFMTVCYLATPLMRREGAAAVHVDGTARPQLVRRQVEPGLHALLRAYRELTGQGVLVNTSFNMHEEPIVRSPGEAVAAFLKAGLDALAIGPFIATRP